MTILLRPFPAAVAALCLASGIVHASWFDLPAGGSSFKLLKLDAHPASLALSGAGAALPSADPIRNPATDSVQLATLSGGYGATFSKLDGSLQQVGWSMPGDSSTWSALIRFQGFENIPGRDEEDRSTGSYSASAWAVDAGYSRPLPFDGLRVGATLGAGMDMLADASSFAGWIGLGATYSPSGAHWSVGASLRNIGLGTTHASDLPGIAQAGFAWRQNLGTWILVPMADVKYLADEDIQFPVALEARWSILSLRTGYVLNRDEFLPSFGIGLNTQDWTVDAGTAWHDALGFAPALRIGIKI